MKKIAFQGVYGAYSHIACTKIFNDAEYIACDTFEQAIASVQNDKADYAVIPVENSNALYKSLGGFATNGVNLNKIESYVIGGNFVSAQFYIEVESHPHSRAYKNALAELEFYSQSVEWLGTYKKQNKLPD